jgi:hypothetical protein
MAGNHLAETAPTPLLRSMEADGGVRAAGAPNLQAGGRLFESGTAHWQNACRAGRLLAAAIGAGQLSSEPPSGLVPCGMGAPPDAMKERAS